ncbi:MAG: DMT family transporter [Clostridiales bacterium]|nr:DMT family transporter [Candidatus Crickella equi]
MFAYVLGLIAGLAQPTQTSINGSLGAKVKSPYISTLVSFGTAVIILVLIDVLTQGGIHIPFADIAQYPWWIWTGGLCGVGIVVLSIVCLPHIGSAMVVVMTSFGQIAASLIIDQFGLFESPQISMTVSRAIGALILIGGVILASRTTSEEGAAHQQYPPLYMILAFIVGVLCGLQIAINGTLGKVAGNSWMGTTISMSVGFIGTALLIALLFIARGHNGLFSKGEDIPFKWYMVTGGSMGVIIVGTNAITAPIIGAGMVSIMNLIGFMIGGLVIDAVGFLGIDKKPVTAIKIIGVLAMIGGTVVITLL